MSDLRTSEGFSNNPLRINDLQSNCQVFNATGGLSFGFLDAICEGLCHVEWIERTGDAKATDLLSRHADKEYSFCDALSFVVAERLGVDEAMAFDRHFRSYGRLTLL